MYKIFNENRIVLLSNTDETINLSDCKSMLKYRNEEQLQLHLKLFEDNKNLTVTCIYSDDLENLFKVFKKHHSYIEAAGGIVKNKENQFLAIYRLNMWDLPKGKIENDEIPKEAAIREVEEECGITNLEIVKEETPTYHIYEYKNKKVLKKTYWYQMFYPYNEKLIPQIEEDIEKVKWFNSNQKDFFKENTYESLKELVDYI